MEMNKTLKMTKYQLVFFLWGFVGFYGSRIFFSFLNLFNNGQTSIGGGELILPLIMGLISFKGSYYFSQANNLPRRIFNLANVLALAVLSLVIALVQFACGYVALNFFPAELSNETMFHLIYSANLGQNFLLEFVFFMFIGLLGWFLYMLFYRANTWQRILLSLTPVFAYWIGRFANRISGGMFIQKLGILTFKAFGLATEIPNVLMATVSFGALALVLWLLNSLLMYKMPIKA